MKFTAQLIKWYDQNHRDLPWRHTRNPYQIWLSEIILQQTRVDQGLSYFEKFCSLFPTIKDLAAASEDEVLKAWQGLGYYSRARNLHFTAKFIVEHKKGRFPENFADLLQLKGVGNYTAAAIASFSFGESVPAIDGNVNRVISRAFGIYDPQDSNAGKAAIKAKAEELIKSADPAAFNQAMMEFGAMHCTPKNPKCDACFFQKNCVAFLNDDVAILPAKSKKTAVKDVWMVYFFIHHNGQTYIKRRDESGIWKGLYDFPVVESESAIDPETTAAIFLSENFKSEKPEVRAVSNEYTHILSHRKIHAWFITITLHTIWKNPHKNLQKVDTARLSEYGIPRLIDRFLTDFDANKL